ncbi:MAG: hypothetical protein ACKOC5_07585 [Chloroflexota bacterium]
MPSVIDPETINADELPGIWSPVQWPLNEDERIVELHNQAVASLMMTIDAPEAILRLLLNEHEIDRTFDPPEGFDPEQQGEWDPEIITYEFRRRMRLEKIERTPQRLYLEYKVEDLGFWAIDIEAEHVEIYRL